MDVLDIAISLVRTASINPGSQAPTSNQYGEGAMGGAVKNLLRQAGANEVVATYPLPGRPNIVAYFDAGADDSILLEAHLDTVPVKGMTVAPFGGDVHEAKLWGRGACDVKGPMAAMIAAIASERAADTLAKNVVFAAVCDEESGFSGVRHLLENLNPEWRSTVRYAIVAEPTDLQPVVAHKGVVRWSAEARGRAAHSSTPQLGRNAIYAMADALKKLQQHAEELSRRSPHPQLGAPSLSVGVVTGGSAVNIVPDYCRAEIDRRLIPGETPEEALKQVLAAVADCNDVSFTSPYVAAPALEVDSDCAAARACLAAATAVGVQATPQYANYCTDASFYPQHGIEAVVFGPGSITQAHTADEFIEIEQLRKGVEAYRAILRAPGA